MSSPMLTLYLSILEFSGSGEDRVAGVERQRSPQSQGPLRARAPRPALGAGLRRALRAGLPEALGAGLPPPPKPGSSLECRLPSDRL